MTSKPDIEHLRAQERAKVRAEQPEHVVAAAGAQFSVIAEGRYRIKWPQIAVGMEIDRLRREHQELVGELSVRCLLPGARTVGNGHLSIADLNLSSARARQERANHLAGRANTDKLDWTALLEDFCQRVLQADRAGQPAIDLREVPRPQPDDNITVDGLTLPRRHPSILFGDGGAAKSYTALYVAGRLTQQGTRVALFDWELAAEDHRERLELLFGEKMPQILYARCERPLIHEVDRLKRIVHENRVEYAIFDSVAFACDGPPEAAEVAGRYFRSLRQIGGGSLHIAHVSKAEGADQKPFGSAFWHNGARCCWYVKLADDSAGSNNLCLGLFNRKANLGRLRPPVGFTVTFSEERTEFLRAAVADHPDLAARLTVTQRMQHLLRSGARTVTEIADELGIEVNTVSQTVTRHVKKGRVFIVLEGQNTNRKVGLLGA